jgi:cell division transport system ATP-binding protein
LKYGRGGEVLHDVSFHLRPGSFHFLTGPSGSGKTSLLRLLFMSTQPTRGAIHVFGQDISRVTPSKRAQLRRRIGIVFQDFRLLEHMTTWENVAMPLRVTGKRVADYREDVTDLLQWVGLGDRMRSAGMMPSQSWATKVHSTFISAQRALAISTSKPCSWPSEST